MICNGYCGRCVFVSLQNSVVDSSPVPTSGWTSAAPTVDAQGRPRSAGLGSNNNISSNNSKGSGGVVAISRPTAVNEGRNNRLYNSTNAAPSASPSQPQPQPSSAGNNALSYGSLKNRFLSGSKAKTGSKLFSLSR